MSNRFGNFYYKQAAADNDGFEIFEFGAPLGDIPIDWEATIVLAANNCQRRYINVLTQERDALKADRDNEKGIRECYERCLESIEEVTSRWFQDDTLASVREVVAEHDVLKAREQRFIKHLDALSKLVGLMVHVVPGGFLLEQIEAAAGILDISPMVNPGTDWYHYTEAQVLEMLSKAEISESGAAYLLDTHIIDVRVRMEKVYGAHWRDIADEA